MGADSFSWHRLQNMPVVGIIRKLSLDAPAHIFPLYLDAGLTTVEITLNTPGAEGMIRDALGQYKGKLNIGAGTVCNMKDLDRALAAGAQFIVTPLVEEQVIRTCVNDHIPVFPGAFTPTEIYRAWDLGADMVKLFPATALGPEYVKDLKGPFPQIKVMPTGGVTLDNVAAFLQAGAAGLGMGSQLFDPALIRQKSWGRLKEHFESLVYRIKSFHEARIHPASSDYLHAEKVPKRGRPPKKT